MDNYRVLLYFGQMDLRVGYAPAMEYIKVIFYSRSGLSAVGVVLKYIYFQTLKWKGAKEYKNADRKLYKVGDKLAGYVKTSGNFTEMMVRNAGHFVPTNQPEWALDMYNKFIFNIPFAR